MSILKSIAGLLYVNDKKVALDEDIPTEFGIGYEQTWQDLTASRSAGVTYTNTTGKPIFISVSSSSETAGMQITISVDGIIIQNELQNDATSKRMNVSGLVPNNSTYAVTLNVGTVDWKELR